MKTGRPRKLDDDVAVLVKVRIDIARASNIITQKDIAKGFGISGITLRRYYFPADRALSLKVAKAYALTKGSHKLCEDCQRAYTNHLRCLSCGILMHADPVPCRCGEQHGLTFDDQRCTNCLAAQRRMYT